MNDIKFFCWSKLYKFKNNILKNAACIDLEDFIERYGNSTAWTIASLYYEDYENTKLSMLMNNAKVIKSKQRKSY